MPRKSLQDQKVSIRIKLTLLWSSIVFCFIYGDYFELYAPNKLASMLDGKIGPLGAVTQGKLLGTSVMMAIPSMMVALPALLKAKLSKWLNIIVALFFTAITIIVIQGSWHFYILFGVIEIILLLSVVWHAFKWPREDA